jgi:uncharacterized protein YceK
MRKLALLLTTVALIAGCSSINEAQKQHELARTKGKYKVKLTAESEEIAGRCKYVHALVADDEPSFRPTDAELPDWFRTEAVYKGADTVVVKGRIGEAYICGPGPLNPDGSLRVGDAGAH